MANLFAEIGAKIEAFLKAKKMTQTDFADKIGVSKQVMGKIIHGNKAISLIEIGKIATVMGTSVDDLMRKIMVEEKTEPVFLMMGRAENPNTNDKLRFLNHVMEEMIALDQLLIK